MIGIQILGIAFGLIMIYFIFLHYKRREFKKSQFLVWVLIWVVFILIVADPNSIRGLVRDLGVARVMDLLTIIGFMVLTYLTFRNYMSLNKFKKKLEEKTREDALKELQS